MRMFQPLAALVAVVATSTVAAAAPGPAAGEEWGALQQASGSTLAVALDGGTTALISVGGPDDATIYDQRRRPDGTLGARTEITTVAGAEDCRPVAAATALGNLAAAVECRVKTAFEDPPTRLVELVWTAGRGWVWQVRREGVLGSVDYSPLGQYVVFATNSQYGRRHHVTTYNAGLGWRDLTRRELGPTGDDLVAAVDDSGEIVAVRGAGFEDEPGYWFGGRLRIETYRDRTGWTRELTRRYVDGGIEPLAVDLAAGRVAATVVRSRSTGQVDGRDSLVTVLSGTPSAPQSWSSRRWTRDVLNASAALTRDGVAVASWQVTARARTARSRLATWAPRQDAPLLLGLGAPTTLTDAVRAGGGLDVAVSPAGRVVIASVRHLRGGGDATVTATSYVVQPTGDLGDRVEATWQQPVNTTVTSIASDDAASVTLGRLVQAYPSPLTQYAILAPAAVSRLR